MRRGSISVRKIVRCAAVVTSWSDRLTSSFAPAGVHCTRCASLVGWLSIASGGRSEMPWQAERGGRLGGALRSGSLAAACGRAGGQASHDEGPEGLPPGPQRCSSSGEPKFIQAAWTAQQPHPAV